MGRGRGCRAHRALFAARGRAVRSGRPELSQKGCGEGVTHARVPGTSWASMPSGRPGGDHGVQGDKGVVQGGRPATLESRHPARRLAAGTEFGEQLRRRCRRSGRRRGGVFGLGAHVSSKRVKATVSPPTPGRETLWYLSAPVRPHRGQLGVHAARPRISGEALGLRVPRCCGLPMLPPRKIPSADSAVRRRRSAVPASRASSAAC